MDINNNNDDDDKDSDNDKKRHTAKGCVSFLSPRDAV